MNLNLHRLRYMSLAAAVLAVASAWPAFAQYRWTDPSGQVNYGDAPPADAKNISRVDGRPRVEGADPTGGIPFELRKAMSTLPLTLYTAPDCGPCDSARIWLRQRGTPYQEIMVETEVDAEELKQDVTTRLKEGRGVLGQADESLPAAIEAAEKISAKP